MKSFLQLLSLSLLISLSPLSGAGANPVTWNLVGVTFQSGSTATGSFTFDAGTGAISAWDITVNNESGISCTGGAGSDCIFSPATNVSSIGSQAFPYYWVPSSNPGNVYMVWFASDTAASSAPGPLVLILDLGSLALTDAGGVVPIVPGSNGLSPSSVNNQFSASADFITAGQLSGIPSCPDGEVWDGSYHRCMGIIKTCPVGEVWNANDNQCTPNCPAGQIWNANDKKCTASPVTTCPVGQVWNPTDKKCELRCTAADATSGCSAKEYCAEPGSGSHCRCLECASRN
jgi:hypothetical protein